MTSQGIVSLVPITAIYVLTYLDSRTGQMSPIIAKIPIIAAPMSFIQYENPNGHRVRIREKHVNIIQVTREQWIKPDGIKRLKAHRYEGGTPRTTLGRRRRQGGPHTGRSLATLSSEDLKDYVWWPFLQVPRMHYLEDDTSKLAASRTTQGWQ